MKRLYILALLAFSFTFGQAQTVKIIKDGQVIGAYPAGTYDEVVFAPENASAAQAIAGKYEADREVTLVEMPQMGVVVTDKATIAITAASDNTVNISLPDCYYAQMDMTLPGATVKDIEINSEDAAYSFNVEFSGTDASEKTYTGTLSAKIYSPSNFEIVETMKYGTMPFTLTMKYTPANKAE